MAQSPKDGSFDIWHAGLAIVVFVLIAFGLAKSLEGPPTHKIFIGDVVVQCEPRGSLEWGEPNAEWHAWVCPGFLAIADPTIARKYGYHEDQETQD